MCVCVFGNVVQVGVGVNVVQVGVGVNVVHVDVECTLWEGQSDQ